jgi:hypothetical protein
MSGARRSTPHDPGAFGDKNKKVVGIFVGFCLRAIVSDVDRGLMRSLTTLLDNERELMRPWVDQTMRDLLAEVFGLLGIGNSPLSSARRTTCAR